MSLCDATRHESGVLAIDGGRPVCSHPAPGWPHFDEQAIAAAGAVLASGRVNYWTGEHGRRFEEEFARWVGARHAVALANGTLALELALAALQLEPGAEVIVPAATFIATASAVARVGLIPVIADIDPVTQCLSEQTVRAALTAQTRAIIVVHLGGFPADIEPILSLARERRLRLIEDCAQAHGARRAGRMVGTFGDIAAWSFCQDKIITTAGEGGAVTTDDPLLHRAVWEAKDHGKSYARVYQRRHPPGFRWLHEHFGTNARMTEIAAAIGRLQLGQIEGWLAVRRRHAMALRAALSRLPLLYVPALPTDIDHAWYRCYVRIRPEVLAEGWDRDRFVRAVNAEGVACQQGSCFEIHRERAFTRQPTTPTPTTPVAHQLGHTAMALPVHPTLADDDIRDTITAVTKVAHAATRQRTPDRARPSSLVQARAHTQPEPAQRLEHTTIRRHNR